MLLRFANDNDVAYVMFGRNEHACKRFLALLNASQVRLYVRQMSWLLSEESLRSLGLQRGRYMWGISPREYCVLFSKVPLQRPHLKCQCCLLRFASGLLVTRRGA